MYDRCIPTTKAVLSAGVDVVVDVTANHLGYFSFNLCPAPSPAPSVDPSQACFDSHPLTIQARKICVQCCRYIGGSLENFQILEKRRKGNVAASFPRLSFLLNHYCTVRIFYFF